MHDTALEIGKAFFDIYWHPSFGSILDVGSKDVNGSLRSIAPKNSIYVGMDQESGKGVDVISNRFPFKDESFDCIISSSCFEHDPMFWVTFIGCCRVLKPEGFIYINAPSNGPVHNHPVDCWRFYPDAGYALEKWAFQKGFRLSLIESFTAKSKKDVWNDYVMVFGKGRVRPTRFLKDIFK